MGGSGSGTWYRWDTRRTIDDVMQLDVRMMARNAWLLPGVKGEINWRRNNQPWGSISYQSFINRLVLSFRYRVSGQEWGDVTQEIAFDETQCNYGNIRKWFVCPGCHRRCALLYSGGKYFLCRKCYKLPYKSQRQTKIDRLISQKHELGERIFDDYHNGSGWKKRKGMHQRTFDRLSCLYAELEISVDEYLARFL